MLKITKALLKHIRSCPDLPFLAFWISWLLHCKDFPGFFAAFFPSFSGILGVRHSEKNLVLGWFSLFFSFQKSKERKIRVGRLSIMCNHSESISITLSQSH